MLIRHLLVDYFNGLRASLYGFFVLHKLDSTREDGDERVGRAKSASKLQRHESPPKVSTVLKQRRLANATQALKSSAEEMEPQKPSAAKRVLQCMALNVSCVMALQFIILPFIKLITYIAPFDWPNHMSVELISNAMSIMWILPIFLITRLVNALWFSDIANASLQYLGLQPAVPISFSRAAADFLVAMLVEVVFLLQSLVMVYLPIPIIAPFITFFHLALLHALYSFEYFWMSQGFELRKRLAKIERCWPYFLGFGTPLTLLTTISSNFIVNGCLFGMFFPFFIVSSYLAEVKVESELSMSMRCVHIFWPSLIVTNRISNYLCELASVKQTTHQGTRRPSSIPPSRNPPPHPAHRSRSLLHTSDEQRLRNNPIK